MTENYFDFMRKMTDENGFVKKKYLKMLEEICEDLHYIDALVQENLFIFQI